MLRTGETYDEVIERNLRDAALVVVLWSPRSVKSKWVRAEATIGERKGGLLPVLIEACDRPIAFELVQTPDLAAWTGDRDDARWLAFMADLRGALTSRAAEVRAQTAPPAPDPLTIETLFWSSIKESNDQSDFEVYLDRYPHGHFGDLARNKLKALRQAHSSPVADRPAGDERTAPSATTGRRMPLMSAAVAVGLLLVLGAIGGWSWWIASQPRFYTPGELTAARSVPGEIFLGGRVGVIISRSAPAEFTIVGQGEAIVVEIVGSLPDSMTVLQPLVAIGRWSETEQRLKANTVTVAMDAEYLPASVVAAMREQGFLDSPSLSAQRYSALSDARTTAVSTAADTLQDSSQLSAFALFRDCADCPDMVVLPAGSFLMGSPADEPLRGDDEGPQRNVSIRSFAVGRFEVTFQQWDACVADGGCNGYRPSDEGWRREFRPVINVSWEDAQNYVEWLSRRSSQAYRLLTEAEWEYASRAGARTAYSTGTSLSADEAKFGGIGGGTQIVGAYPANAFGLYDMHGNVWEWVQDCYVPSYSGATTDGAARTESPCSQRVYRGGGWNYPLHGLRSANRERTGPSDMDASLGFRVARTI